MSKALVKAGKAKIEHRITASSSMVEGSSGKEGIPDGAKILSKTINTSSEEIKNGYILSKSYDIKYSVKGETNYTYYTEKWYSKENPIKVEITDKSLADQFDEEE